MAEALIGVVGIVVGALLGGTGKYWLLRRDAWSEARTSGLLLLADVRTLRNADATAHVVSETRAGAKSWETHREILAGFRRGNFPNGFRAPEWLELASHFARLEQIYAVQRPEGSTGWWSQAKTELAAAELLLARFDDDPAVFGYVVRATVRR